MQIRFATTEVLDYLRQQELNYKKDPETLQGTYKITLQMTDDQVTNRLIEHRVRRFIKFLGDDRIYTYRPSKRDVE